MEFKNLSLNCVHVPLLYHNTGTDEKPRVPEHKQMH